jgi:hypothetical protein
MTITGAYLLGWSPLIVWALLALLLTKGLKP